MSSPQFSTMIHADGSTSYQNYHLFQGQEVNLQVQTVDELPDQIPSSPQPILLIDKAYKAIQEGRFSNFLATLRHAPPEEVANTLFEFSSTTQSDQMMEAITNAVIDDTNPTWSEQVARTLFDLGEHDLSETLKMVSPVGQTWRFETVKRPTHESTPHHFPLPFEVPNSRKMEQLTAQHGLDRPPFPFDTPLETHQMGAFLDLVKTTFSKLSDRTRPRLTWQIDAPQPHQITTLVSLRETQLCFVAAETDKFLLHVLSQLIGKNDDLKLTHAFVAGVPYPFPSMADFFSKNRRLPPSEELRADVIELHKQGDLKYDPDIFIYLMEAARSHNMILVGIDTKLTRQLEEMMCGTHPVGRERLNMAKDVVIKQIIDQIHPKAFAVFVQSDRPKWLLTSQGDRALARLLRCPTIAILTGEDDRFLQEQYRITS